MSVYTKSPFEHNHALEGDGRLVRLTAAAFIKQYKDDINNCITAQRVLLEAKSRLVVQHQELEEQAFSEAMASFAPKAKVINRQRRKNWIRHLRKDWRNRFRTSKRVISIYRRECNPWIWWSFRGWSTGYQFIRSEGMSANATLEQFFDYYRRDWIPEKHRVSSITPLSPRREIEIITAAHEGCAGAFTACYSHESALKLQKAIEILGVASKYPSGQMLYIPVHLLAFIINLNPIYYRPHLEAIAHLDEQLQRIGVEESFLVKLDPAAAQHKLAIQLTDQ
jgi:hypothetical protein